MACEEKPVRRSTKISLEDMEEKRLKRDIFMFILGIIATTVISISCGYISYFNQIKEKSRIQRLNLSNEPLESPTTMP